MVTQATVKYLQNYAESESKDIAIVTHKYDFVVVIPICNEAHDCLQSIFANITTKKVLLIVVVNSATGYSVAQQNNQLFLHYWQSRAYNQTSISANCCLLRFNDFHDILLVDKNSDSLQINADYGVGQARKIGADIALKLFTQGAIKNPWIFSTDADVLLPNDYFNQFTQELSAYSAIILDFEHVGEDKKLQQLQYLYDFKLRYYLAGVSFAGCGYNYIPLGSTLIVNMQCYAQVRGFPRRNAGEDFYILNKLAKVKPIKYCLNNSIVQIKSRFSNRVPFGTGPALVQINKLNDYSEYLYYHPECFILLSKWYAFLLSMWANEKLNVQMPSNDDLQGLYRALNCSIVFNKSKKQITSQKRWQQFVTQWFDAFKVLKTVHYFDKKFSRLNYLQLLNSQSFAKVNNSQLQNFIQTYDKVKSRLNSPRS
ncbi:MAG: hypothetical protein L3J53_01275 [Proteobacteria bacterium]|nr:hypothetical protein [Pseudomonadota bacterium]